MVTQLLRSAVFDVMQVAKIAHFFDAQEAHRLTLVTKELGNYPEEFVLYITAVSETAFVKDASALMEILGANTSVMNEAWRLTQEQNGFFNAFLDAMKALERYRDEQMTLGATLTSFRDAGRKYDRVLSRELQTLLLLSRAEDSAVIQIAIEADLDLSHLPGIPSVTVRRSLLGGSRMFLNGTLNDRSWRARLTKLLTFEL